MVRTGGRTRTVAGRTRMRVVADSRGPSRVYAVHRRWRCGSCEDGDGAPAVFRAREEVYEVRRLAVTKMVWTTPWFVSSNDDAARTRWCGRRQPSGRTRTRRKGCRKIRGGGQGDARGQVEENGRGIRPGKWLTLPESSTNGGGPAELRRRNSTALGHDSNGKERGNGEELVGFK